MWLQTLLAFVSVKHALPDKTLLPAGGLCQFTSLPTMLVFPSSFYRQRSYGVRATKTTLAPYPEHHSHILLRAKGGVGAGAAPRRIKQLYTDFLWAMMLNHRCERSFQEYIETRGCVSLDVKNQVTEAISGTFAAYYIRCPLQFQFT